MATKLKPAANRDIRRVRPREFKEYGVLACEPGAIVYRCHDLFPDKVVMRSIYSAWRACLGDGRPRGPWIIDRFCPFGTDAWSPYAHRVDGQDVDGRLIAAYPGKEAAEEAHLLATTCFHCGEPAMPKTHGFDPRCERHADV